MYSWSASVTASFFVRRPPSATASSINAGSRSRLVATLHTVRHIIMCHLSRRLLEQPVQIFCGQRPDQGRVGGQDRVRQLALLLLQGGDLLLDRVAGDQSVGEDVTRLPDAMRAIDRLRLDSGIPPGIEQEHVFSGSEIETDAAGLQADEEHAAVGIGVEPVDALGAVLRTAIEVLVDQAGLIQPL